jgi:uncharacterized protein YndB with AHSA1/START domain
MDDIAFEADYPQPPEAVWRAIATREGLSSWLMENDLKEARVGEEFQFRDKPRRPFWNGVSECRVIESDPPRKLAILWNHKQDPQPTTVTWTLRPTPSGGTHLSFRHAGFSGFMGMIMRKGMEHGWERKVRFTIPRVAAALAAGAPVPSRDDNKAFEKREARAAA